LVNLQKHEKPPGRVADPGHTQFGAIGQGGWPTKAVGVTDAILVLEHSRYSRAMMAGFLLI
jgi:hypothetical protein